MQRAGDTAEFKNRILFMRNVVGTGWSVDISLTVDIPVPSLVMADSKDFLVLMISRKSNIELPSVMQ